MAARYIAARDALGHPFLLQPAGGASAAFLRRVVSLADCALLLEVADLGDRLPHERIAMLAISGIHENEWALLSELVAVTAVRSIVVRRTRDLFPLDAVVDAAHRARSVLAQERHPTTERPGSVEPLDDDPTGLATLRSHQSLCFGEETRLASQLRPWQVWRERIDDTHKALQIAQFLAEDRR
jgi:hypothetical protein